MKAAPTIIALLAAGQAVAQVPQTTSQQERLDGNDPVEKKYTITFETTQHKQYCKAQVWIEYLQRNTMAAVNGGIKNEDCGPSAGEYTVSVRFRDENGERQSVDFVEQWSREDDQEVLFEGEYFMGENVDLINARARKVSCVCAPTGEEEDKGEEE